MFEWLFSLCPEERCALKRVLELQLYAVAEGVSSVAMVTLCCHGDLSPDCSWRWGPAPQLQAVMVSLCTAQSTVVFNIASRAHARHT